MAQRRTLQDFMKFLAIALQNSAAQNPNLCADESSPVELEYYLEMARDYYNTQPPLANYQFENFPSFSWLIHRAVIEALFCKGLVQDRNTVNVVVYGENIEDFGKGDKFTKWIQVLVGSSESHLDNLKRAINISNGFADSHSQYARLRIIS